MAKRKRAAKKPVTKKKERLPSVFPCVFCNHEKSVVVKIMKKDQMAKLDCKVCGQTYRTGIHYLTAAVDVYAEWVDACEAVAKETVVERAPKRLRTAGPQASGMAASASDE